MKTRVEFPQYAARWKQIGEPPNVSLIACCPLCDKEVVQRTWLGFEAPRTESEYHAMAASRLKDSKVDREVYWKHLTEKHPEEFE